MRCRSLLAEAALVAIALSLALVAGTAEAQVSAGGETVKGGARLEATLVAGAAGDPQLSGSADLVVNPRRGSVCFDIELDAVVPEAETVVAVHIHPGVAAAAPCDAEDCAPPLDLDFANEGLEGCVRAGKHLLSSLAEEPEQFFLHVHTARFPEGAVSGQLEED